MSDQQTETQKQPQAKPAQDPAVLAMQLKRQELTVSDPARAAAATGIGAFELAQREATAMAQSSVLPTAFRQYNDEGKENPDAISNCMIAIEFARRIGMAPLAVIQNMNVIHGKPGLSSAFLIATVNASKRFTPLRFEWVGTPGKDDFGCRAFATSKEDGEKCIGAAITWALVKAEGWDKKSGSKWKTMPEQMFQYRAAAFWTRVFAPELSMGIRPIDEIEDMPFSSSIDVPALTSSTARDLEAKILATPNVPAPPPSGEPLPEAS